MSRKQLILYGVLLVCGGISCWFFPLFHIRKLNASNQAIERPKSTTDNQDQVEGLLESAKLRKLDAYLTRGTEVNQLWSAFDSDKAKAKIQFGRQAGLGGAWYFCVRGQGTVASVEKDQVTLTVVNSHRRVRIELGAVVDNTVREAVAIKASDFPNSQEFNAVSMELNRQVEQDVIATNRAILKPGAVVEFVGCSKISRDSDLDPLCLIPIQLKVSSNAGVAPHSLSCPLVINKQRAHTDGPSL